MTLEEIKEITISCYNYDLPEERIALHPLAQRDACKLLACSISNGEYHIQHTNFRSIADFLKQDTLLICNDTRVINARIKFKKESGATIETFLLEPISPADYSQIFQSRHKCRWSCLIGNLKRWKSDTIQKNIHIADKEVTLTARRIVPLDGNAHEVEFEWDEPTLNFADIIDAAGFIPIPPYLRRDTEASDSDDYQTIYARHKGSVAAPTAGLHFTPQLFDELHKRGVNTASVTLHVGAGTFQPVKSEEIGAHPMHTETFEISRHTLIQLRDALREGRNIVAVGTTSVRTLESLPLIGLKIRRGIAHLNVKQWEAYSPDSIESLGHTPTQTAELIEEIITYMEQRDEEAIICTTSIMIAPGFRWRLVDGMITNFHQPQSTLLLLVSSFLGKDSEKEEMWRTIYNEALSRDYRFLSYGDACLFLREAKELMKLKTAKERDEID